jgi:hypothetical protein
LAVVVMTTTEEFFEDARFEADESVKGDTVLRAIMIRARAVHPGGS